MWSSYKPNPFSHYLKIEIRTRTKLGDNTKKRLGGSVIMSWKGLSGRFSEIFRTEQGRPFDALWKGQPRHLQHKPLWALRAAPYSISCMPFYSKNQSSDAPHNYPARASLDRLYAIGSQHLPRIGALQASSLAPPQSESPTRYDAGLRLPRKVGCSNMVKD